MHTLPHILFAQDKHLDGCKALENHPNDEWILKAINHQEIIIAILANELIGYLKFTYFWQGLPFIQLIKVKKELRGNGTGKAMLQFLEDYTKQQGQHVILSSSQANEVGPNRWHLSMGFSKSGVLEAINEGGIDEILYMKSVGNELVD